MADNEILTAKGIRKLNLESLLKKHGGTKTGFAARCGMSQSAFSQLIGKNPVRNIGDALARKIELKLGLHSGYLDTHHDIEIIKDINLITVKYSASVSDDGYITTLEPLKQYINFTSESAVFALLIKTQGLFPRINSYEYIVLSHDKVTAGSEVYLTEKGSSAGLIRKVEQITDDYYKLATIVPSIKHAPVFIEKSSINFIYKISAIVSGY